MKGGPLPPAGRGPLCVRQWSVNGGRCPVARRPAGVDNNRTTDGVLETIIAVFDNMQAVVVVSAALIYIGVEGGAMLAERYLRRRFQEGREEGRQEQQAAWSAWYERMVDAQRRGEPFAEPPPKMEESGG